MLLEQGSVIRGWDEGVMMMKEGEISRLTCTPDYAYGKLAWRITSIRSSVVSQIKDFSDVPILQDRQDFLRGGSCRTLHSSSRSSC